MSASAVCRREHSAVRSLARYHSAEPEIRSQKITISKTISLNPGISSAWALIALTQKVSKPPVQHSIVWAWLRELHGKQRPGTREGGTAPAHSLPWWPCLPFFSSWSRLPVSSATSQRSSSRQFLALKLATAEITIRFLLCVCWLISWSEPPVEWQALTWIILHSPEFPCIFILSYRRNSTSNTLPSIAVCSPVTKKTTGFVSLISSITLRFPF